MIYNNRLLNKACNVLIFKQFSTIHNVIYKTNITY